MSLFKFLCVAKQKRYHESAEIMKSYKQVLKHETKGTGTTAEPKYTSKNESSNSNNRFTHDVKKSQQIAGIFFV